MTPVHISEHLEPMGKVRASVADCGVEMRNYEIKFQLWSFAFHYTPKNVKVGEESDSNEVWLVPN